jgi:glutamate--cysteine ligase
MARDVVELTPIESRDELVAWFEKGIKSETDFRLGTEHEKFPFYRQSLMPVPYEGQRGIRALLEGMQGLLGWEPILEGDHPIGLYDVTGGGAISLEPGGQFELSGAPVETLHQTCSETASHLAQLKEIAEPFGISFLALGASPLWTLEQTSVMPKARYKIMARYMPKVGSHGLDMMFRTSTVQVNLDYGSESDMVKKLRVGLALQPISTALFANSPFLEGKLNGFQSYRSEIWRDTDNQRAGMLPFAFQSGMAEALSRNAGSRCRTAADHNGVFGALGRAALSWLLARRRLRSDQGLERRRATGPAGRCAEAGPQCRDRGTECARARRRHAGPCKRRPVAAPEIQCFGPG